MPPPTSRVTPTRTERGAASLLMVAVVAVGLALCAAIGTSSPALVDRARAESVADLSALAGVSGGRDAAWTVARGSGAELVHVRGELGGTVVVEVSLGGQRATASAAPEGPTWPEEPVGGP